MPQVRSVKIDISVSYLNALVECVLLRWCVTILQVRSDQQNHPDADWPFGAVEKCTFSTGWGKSYGRLEIP